MKNASSDAFNFVYPGLCGEWFSGVPLGNGDLGAIMIPEHKQITFPLAKSNVWDELCDDGSGRRRSFRMAKSFDVIKRWVEKGKWDEIDRRFSKARKNWSGKFRLLPAGDLILSTVRFEQEIELLNFGYSLDMKRGEGSSSFSTRLRHQKTDAFVSVDHDVLALRIKHAADWGRGNPIRKMKFGLDISYTVNSSDPSTKVESGAIDGIFWRRVRGYYKVDYTVAILVSGRKATIGAKQITVLGEKDADFSIFVAIVSNKDVSDPKAEALRRVKAAARIGFDQIQETHRRWWTRYWKASEVKIPERNILRQYHFGLYLLGSSSRAGHQMPGLQGLWSPSLAGSGWNDYTTDLNIQMNYWPIYASNHLELGQPYYDTVIRWIPKVREFTREYWKCRGIQFSCCSSPDGIMPVGYITTLHWAGHAAFVAQNFWSHYRFSRDKEFLRRTAFPLLKECVLFYLDFLKKDKRGLYEIWPSNTPEAGEGSYEAWGKNPAMDIALIKLLFAAVIESCHVLDCDSNLAAFCQERLDHMPSYPVQHGSLIEMESKEFKYSHRHPGMLTAIYPCSDIVGSLAKRSIDRYLEKGQWMWCGFSPVWVAGACARIGRGEEAYRFLREFMEVYTLEQGGFHLNFDYRASGRGHSGPKTFTNEANSGFSAALLEMLLQSNSGLIKIFPAVPDMWKEISFKNLRADGAFLVSAFRKNGKTREIVIHGEQGGTVRVKTPWRKQPFTLTLKRGETRKLRPS